MLAKRRVMSSAAAVLLSNQISAIWTSCEEGIICGSSNGWEMFDLRIAQSHVEVATSFADISRLNDVQSRSSGDMSEKQGLLANLIGRRKVLLEVSRSSFVLLTNWFTTVVAYCEPSGTRDIQN